MREKDTEENKQRKRTRDPNKNYFEVKKIRILVSSVDYEISPLLPFLLARYPPKTAPPGPPTAKADTASDHSNVV